MRLKSRNPDQTVLELVEVIGTGGCAGHITELKLWPVEAGTDVTRKTADELRQQMLGHEVEQRLLAIPTQGRLRALIAIDRRSGRIDRVMITGRDGGVLSVGHGVEHPGLVQALALGRLAVPVYAWLMGQCIVFEKGPISGYVEKGTMGIPAEELTPREDRETTAVHPEPKRRRVPVQAKLLIVVEMDDGSRERYSDTLEIHGCDLVQEFGVERCTEPGSLVTTKEPNGQFMLTARFWKGRYPGCDASEVWGLQRYK